jgi:predicted DNA-binding WGR domain protein
MRNKAKCKLCGSIIESCHPTDYVVCKCGEIELNGGDAMLVRANDFNNLLRVDDLGNEITVRYERIESNGQSDKQQQTDLRPSEFNEVVDTLERMLELDEEFLAKGQNSSINRFELIQYMKQIIYIFKRLKEG